MTSDENSYVSIVLRPLYISVMGGLAHEGGNEVVITGTRKNIASLGFATTGCGFCAAGHDCGEAGEDHEFHSLMKAAIAHPDIIVVESENIATQVYDSALFK
jgi:hypothetical protein